jgi:hypothetical protein
MTAAERCRQHAAHCLSIAQNAANPQDKYLLLDMAIQWKALAEAAEAEDTSRQSPNLELKFAGG